MPEAAKIAATPPPPYYAVIFSSTLGVDTEAYEAAAQQMIELAKTQPGFLGIESARNTLGISVSYWADLASIQHWKTMPNICRLRRLAKHAGMPVFTSELPKWKRPTETAHPEEENAYVFCFIL
jgi:heme-degrading monooxygenase HmoA